MSIIYLAALAAVLIAILALAADAVVAVARKPDWRVPQPRLALVETVDRRNGQLPFVGAERRREEQREAADAPDRQDRLIG